MKNIGKFSSFVLIIFCSKKFGKTSSLEFGSKALKGERSSVTSSHNSNMHYCGSLIQGSFLKILNITSHYRMALDLNNADVPAYRRLIAQIHQCLGLESSDGDLGARRSVRLSKVCVNMDGTDDTQA